MNRFLVALLALLLAAPALGQKIGFLGVGGDGDGTGVQSWNARTGDVVPTFGDYLEVLGGTGHNSYTLGDLLYSDGPDSLGILSIGVENSFLTITGGIPVWLDEIDGDRLNIDYVPTNYTPVTGPSHTSTEDLTSHLQGIDEDFLPHNMVQRMAWRLAPTANGFLDMLGWNLQTNAAASLASGVPVAAGMAAYHSHWVFDISAAVGLPFTLRITGDSIDEVTGAVTNGDTEDIAVTANGYYQSLKSWIDASDFDIVEAAKSATADIYRTTYWDRGNTNFRIVGSRFEWTPGAPAWSIDVDIEVVENDGSITSIDSLSFASTDGVLRAANGEPGKHKRGDYSRLVTAAQNSGMLVSVNQIGIEHFYIEVKYFDE